METSSNWISKAKSADFLPSGTFFFKNHGEKLKKLKNVPKAPKMTKSEIFWIPGMVCN